MKNLFGTKLFFRGGSRPDFYLPASLSVLDRERHGKGTRQDYFPAMKWRPQILGLIKSYPHCLFPLFCRGPTLEVTPVFVDLHCLDGSRFAQVLFTTVGKWFRPFAGALAGSESVGTVLS
ncbi:MAG: hypothetical protein H7315_07725 [Herminiimonas sp.]|nr:hypothetical protein [Herminiimonas sp.]